MGRASRLKKERRETRESTPVTPRPQWAGAPGFDRAYTIAQRYASVYSDLASARARASGVPAKPAWSELTVGMCDTKLAEYEALMPLLYLRRDMADRQLATIVAAQGGRDTEPERQDDPVVLPGRAFADEKIEEYLPYAKGLSRLANDHIAHMAKATPVVFDPLASPEPSIESLVGLGLPFPVVVTDFLAPGGMSLPVQAMKSNGWWVGLIAATVSQGEEGGPVDVWPTVTTLRSNDKDNAQQPKEMMFGRIRFGGPLPPAPEGLIHVSLEDSDAWVVDIEDPYVWAMLWLRAPALAAISALRILDAVNVELIDVPMSRPVRRRAEREGVKPALYVDVRTSAGQAGGTSAHGTIEWTQRWTVRGHWKHFGEHTAVARRHPSRVIDVPGRGRCVKVWCPPFIKGPADKPLVLKTRVVPATQELVRDA